MKAQLTLAALLAAGSLLLTPNLSAQFAERSSLPGSGARDVDASGRSIKAPRVRAVHSDNPKEVGGVAYLFQNDPYLAYQLGRNLNFREFRERDGVFTPEVANLAGPMPDGTTAKITANNHTSCSGCHNYPQGNAGAGVNFHKDSGFGRNTPHYYGAGVLEMLAIQTRAKMMRQLDLNNDGWVNASEAQSAPFRLFVRPGLFSPPIDFGSGRLSNNTTGTPALNNIFRVWYVDQNGQHVPGATRVDGTSTFGYNFNLIVWGWGQGPGRSALNPTNRVFLWDPFVTHSGLDSHDPTTLNDPDGDGVSEPSLAGAIQFPATHRAPDAGDNLDPLGFSRDDPDGDGHLTEISEGDLDLGEWFMLNAPRPAFAGTLAEYNLGVQVLNLLRCDTCHTPNWDIESKSLPGETSVHTFAGDRRFFDLDVQWDNIERELKGSVQKLYTRDGESYVRNLGSAQISGVFSDLRQHDMGDGFRELDFGGNVNTVWRTAPLWGVGSSFPWGHDGQSLTLDDVIRRHGGEGMASRQAYVTAPPFVQEWICDWLGKLVLYDVETLPTDVDGDGQIVDNFIVSGQNTGQERFNPEWLFANPLEIQGNFVNTDGVTIRSSAGTNIAEAYGLDLPFRRDSDLDGWPDVWDQAPGVPGFRDGVK